MVFKDDPRSFMYYQKQYYINGTIVEFSESYLDANKFNGKKIWKYAKFDRRINTANGVLFFFCLSNTNTLYTDQRKMKTSVLDEYATYFTIPASMIEDAIKTIIKPIKLLPSEYEKIDNYLDNIDKQESILKRKSLNTAWSIYIIVLVFSLIFNQFYMIWIFASCVFFKWRKEVLNK